MTNDEQGPPPTESPLRPALRRGLLLGTILGLGTTAVFAFEGHANECVTYAVAAAILGLGAAPFAFLGALAPRAWSSPGEPEHPATPLMSRLRQCMRDAAIGGASYLVAYTILVLAALESVHVDGLMFARGHFAVLRYSVASIDSWGARIAVLAGLAAFPAIPASVCRFHGHHKLTTALVTVGTTAALGNASWIRVDPRWDGVEALVFPGGFLILTAFASAICLLAYDFSEVADEWFCRVRARRGRLRWRADA